MTDPLQHLWQSLQLRLFPMLEEELGPLSDKDRLFVQVVSLLDLGKFMSVYQWKKVGCPPRSRLWLLHAFVAMQVYQFGNREALVQALRGCPLLRRLCGWDSVAEVPSLSTFCRAFAQF